ERRLFTWGMGLHEGGLHRDGRSIAVVFDPTALVRGAQLVPMAQLPPDAIAAPVPGWPLAVQTRLDEKLALAGWTAILPLYLFVILGPALAGAWLAVVFVGA